MSYGTGKRQVGSQEAPILDYVRAMTLSSVSVCDPKLLRLALDHSYGAAMSSRPGPAWLDLPVDVSWADV